MQMGQDSQKYIFAAVPQPLQEMKYLKQLLLHKTQLIGNIIVLAESLLRDLSKKLLKYIVLSWILGVLIIKTL
jgi:hypothetical protein